MRDAVDLILNKTAKVVFVVKWKDKTLVISLQIGTANILQVNLLLPILTYKPLSEYTSAPNFFAILFWLSSESDIEGDLRSTSQSP
jgi:hypothetical protein